MCQSINPRVKRKKFWNLLWKLLFFVFGFEQTNSTFSVIFLARFSKLLRTCPSEKKSGISILDSWFFIVFEKWTQRTRNKLENFGWVIKTKFYVSGGKFTEQRFLREIPETFRFSGWIMKFLGQKRNFFIQVAKTEKLCPEEQIKENPFSKAKSLLFFFQDSVSLFFKSSGNVRQSCRNCNLRSLGRLWAEKYLKYCTIFQLWTRFQTSFDFETKILEF